MDAPSRPPTRGEVARVYDEIAEDFARRRQRPWPEVVSFIDEIPPRGRVLDAGCGNGRHAAVLASRGRRVLGVDASPRLLEMASRSVPTAEFARTDLCRLPLRDTSVDSALAIASIHHLPTEEDRLQAVQEIRRVLIPGGRSLFSVWTRDSRDGERSLETGSPGDVWVPWEVGDRRVLRFYHLFRDGELRRLIEAAGLFVERYFRSGDNSFAVARRHG